MKRTQNKTILILAHNILRKIDPFVLRPSLDYLSCLSMAFIHIYVHVEDAWVSDVI